MLIQCLLIIQDPNTPPSQMNARPLRSSVFTKKMNSKFYVCVKNSRFPNIVQFDVAMLKSIYCKFIQEKRLGLEFKEPKKLMLIVADDKKMLYLFYHQLNDILNGKNVTIGTRHNLKTVKLPSKNVVTNRFNPMSLEFVAVDCFDNRILNLRHLNKLVLENCNLPKMPVQVGQLPITYLSISGSKLATSKFDQDTFWNWMSTDSICKTLRTLKMDSVDLKSLPFEIMFLKNLQTLSVAKNMLTYLPHFIAEIQKLQNLNVADNMLLYFPFNPYKTFKNLDISNNLFRLPESSRFNHIQAYMDVFESLKRPDNDLIVKPLSHLSFYSLIDNRVPFKRQDIPRTLWLYFDVVGRCIGCNKCILPDYSIIDYSFTLPRSMNLTRDHGMINVPQQYLSCKIICVGSYL